MTNWPIGGLPLEAETERRVKARIPLEYPVLKGLRRRME
jgi:hypothetical protein